MANHSLLPVHPLFKNLSGQRFGRLCVIEYAGRSGRQRISMWRCRCDCGTERDISATSLHSGTVSCGCLRLERTSEAKRTHGKTGTAEYRAWANMISRCENKNDLSFKDYGGRGIGVSRGWRCSFETFLQDMGNKPTAAHMIDRIDNDGNYEHGNCRWATRTEQNRNRRCNRLVTYKGATKCVSEWAGVVGLPRYTIEKRLDSGWSVERAMTTPKRAWNRNTRPGVAVVVREITNERAGHGDRNSMQDHRRAAGGVVASTRGALQGG